MNLKQVLVIAIITVMGMTSVQAEEIRLRSVGEASAGASAPSAGMTMTRVAAKFGEPNDKLDAVGEPPITRWVYDDFTVYFEHQRVIQAVSNRKKK